MASLLRTGGLDALLGDPSLVIIDARPFGAYSEGHVPGAVNLDTFAFHWADTTDAGMAGFAAQARRMAEFCGAADPGRRAVFYDGESGMAAARGAWTMDYLSRPDAAVLDGGFAKWRAEGRPVETGSNPFEPAAAGACGPPDPGVVAGYRYVLDNMGELAVIDARSAEEYSGSTARAARRGHIPGAANVDWRRNLAGDGTFKEPGRIAEMYGLPRGAEIVAYCQGGYRAANTYLALRLAGYEKVRLYLGSWGEWGNVPGLPAEGGSGGPPPRP